MRGAIAPSALLCAALGLALAFAPRNAWAPSVLALLSTVAALTFVAMPRAWLEGAFLGCWISVITTAGSVQLFAKVTSRAALILAINAGAWSSAITGLSGSSLDLLEALPWVLILWPASWVSRRHGQVPIKVGSSWLTAVAALSIALQLLPVTPGYLPDHME